MGSGNAGNGVKEMGSGRVKEMGVRSIFMTFLICLFSILYSINVKIQDLTLRRPYADP